MRFLRFQWGKVLKNSDRLYVFESLGSVRSPFAFLGGRGMVGSGAGHCHADFADFAPFPDNLSRFT